MAEGLSLENQWIVKECDVRSNGSACYTVVDGAGKRVLQGPYMTLPVARLFAASPKLLAACREFVRKVECGEARSVRSYAQMKDAIAEVEGTDGKR